LSKIKTYPPTVALKHEACFSVIKKIINAVGLLYYWMQIPTYRRRLIVNITARGLFGVLVTRIAVGLLVSFYQAAECSDTAYK